MGKESPDEEAIFKVASLLPVGDTRDAYLDQVCGDNLALVDRLHALLKVHDEGESFLEKPPVEIDATAALTAKPELSAADIGPYKILQEIAEGGMGVVYMAEQNQPVKRRVALKVIKPGMDSRQVIARFEAERQALAMMDHPNIARVFDAGSTDNGRPYFVMELVKGVPITQYCDDNRLSNRERLELFATVCNAIQHAHHKGVIHRDLKPTNILVAEYDDHAVPKIIDFGLAKALNQALTDKTMFTQFGQIVGTIDYMSPEQARFNQLDVDTRSDIYSMGVLLYELMTGTTPFDRQRLRSTDFEELMRIIGEEEPPRPSTRLNTSTTLPALATNRSTDARKLAGLVKGELDWIVMRALQKDRTQRYQTASEFATDVEHYLTDQPVNACPPSVSYRVRKLVWRHKTTLLRATASVLIVSLTIAAAMFGWKYLNSKQEFVAQQTESEREQQTLLQQQQRVQTAHQKLVPRIRRLVEERSFVEAFELAQEVDAAIAEDTTINELRKEFAFNWRVESFPEGADVYWRAYNDSSNQWKYAGRSPIESVTLPNELLMWKVSRDGFEQVIGCRHPEDGVAAFTLHRSEELPEGMVHVSGNAFPSDVSRTGLDKLDLEDFFIDRCEVTNQQFQEFVDQGGYQNRDYWEPTFNSGDQSLSWEELMQMLVDETGQPGPATWRNGKYPNGKADYPVSGLSWYEASAYARYKQKALPTVAHWCRASGVQWLHAVQIMTASNMASTESTPVAENACIGPFGTFDTAGNVSEWCQNGTETGQRALLGGAWNDPAYEFQAWSAKPPLSREATNGFRCVKYAKSGVSAEALALVKRPNRRDMLSAEPISDDMFEICRSHFDYRMDDPNATIVSSNEVEGVRYEVVKIDAAYGQERFNVHLFLPPTRSGPYQPILYFPGMNFFKNDDPFPSDLQTGKTWRWKVPLKLAASGRAVIWPVYSGSFERSRHVDGLVKDPQWWTRVVQDAKCTVDYLETRPDLDVRRLGYLGQSLGSMVGPFVTAIDPRIKAAVFLNGGILPLPMPPQFDSVNFAPQTHCPVLMINGRRDKTFPVATSQRALYKFLGSRPDEKAWMLFDKGHGIGHERWMPDAQAWFDLYLGPLQAEGYGQLHKVKANFAASRGDWHSAAESMIKALNEPAPTPNDQSIDWMQAAVLLLLAGDQDRYEQHCRDMIEHFADSQNPEVWDRMVKSCSLDGESAKLAGTESARLSKAFQEGTLDTTVANWACATVALHTLRLGNAEQSLTLMSDLDHSTLDKSLACLTQSIAAMACWELGQMESAQAHLDSASALINDAMTRGDDGSLVSSDLMWTQQLRHDWLIAEWIRQQATRRLQ